MRRKRNEKADVVEQLREAIRQDGRTLGQLRAASGIGTDRLSRFVRGERGLGLEAFATLCRLLGLELVATGGQGGKDNTRKGGSAR